MTHEGPFRQPYYNLAAFNCPYCGAYAKQEWSVLQSTPAKPNQYAKAICALCQEWSFWVGEKLIFPVAKTAPPPNADLSEDIKEDFEEAREIVSKSPRGAAALLRLCIQKICIELGEPGKDINTDIGALVKKGLLPKVKEALDIVRVVGNEAVHPGVLDLRDDVDTANSLFDLVNMIADQMITRFLRVDKLYNTLPESKRQGIDDRDRK